MYKRSVGFGWRSEISGKGCLIDNFDHFSSYRQRSIVTSVTSLGTALLHVFGFGIEVENASLEAVM